MSRRFFGRDQAKAGRRNLLDEPAPLAASLFQTYLISGWLLADLAERWSSRFPVSSHFGDPLIAVGVVVAVASVFIVTAEKVASVDGADRKPASALAHLRSIPTLVFGTATVAIVAFGVTMLPLRTDGFLAAPIAGCLAFLAASSVLGVGSVWSSSMVAALASVTVAQIEFLVRRLGGPDMIASLDSVGWLILDYERDPGLVAAAQVGFWAFAATLLAAVHRAVTERPESQSRLRALSPALAALLLALVQLAATAVSVWIDPSVSWHRLAA